MLINLCTGTRTVNPDNLHGKHAMSYNQLKVLNQAWQMLTDRQKKNSLLPVLQPEAIGRQMKFYTIKTPETRLNNEAEEYSRKTISHIENSTSIIFLEKKLEKMEYHIHKDL